MGKAQSGPEDSIGRRGDHADGYRALRLDPDDARLADYFHLRWQLLREPLGQPPGSEQDADETGADHIVVVGPDDSFCGVARLHEAMPGQGQVRYMAVAPELRGHGLGRLLLQACERHARGHGFFRVILEARDDARDFYVAQGYVRGNPGKLLYGKVRHTWMHKRLHLDNFGEFGLRLRPAHADDRSATEALIFGVLQEYGLSAERDGIDRDLENFPAFYAAGLFSLLVDGERVVGSVALVPLGTKICELRRMYLDAALRGRGIGRALLGYALGAARARGYHTVEIETARVLHEALDLYRAVGFEEIDGDCEARRCDMRMRLRLSQL